MQRYARVIFTLSLLSLAVCQAQAQTATQWQQVTSFPGICTPNTHIYYTPGTPGSNEYVCNGTNQWVLDPHTGVIPVQDTSVSANTITATSVTGTALSYSANKTILLVKVANTNTGATTININGLGSKAVTQQSTSALTAGMLVAGGEYFLAYDGTQFQLVGGGGSGGGSTGATGATGITGATGTTGPTYAPPVDSGSIALNPITNAICFQDVVISSGTPTITLTATIPVSLVGGVNACRFKITNKTGSNQTINIGTNVATVNGATGTSITLPAWASALTGSASYEFTPDPVTPTNYVMKQAGANGISGATGATGITGATGSTGATGTVGNAFSTLTDGATVTWAIASSAGASSVLTFTVHSGSRTLNITNPVDGGYYNLVLIQDATGGEGLTLGTGCTWRVGNGGAGAITPSVTANAQDVLSFTYRASNTSCYLNFNKAFN